MFGCYPQARDHWAAPFGLKRAAKSGRRSAGSTPRAAASLATLWTPMRRSPLSIRDNIPREIWASAQICSRVLPEALMRCDVSMPTLLHSAKADGKTEFYSGGMARGLPACKSPVMRFRLRQFRTDRRLTQVQVAEALGISVGLYNQKSSMRTSRAPHYVSRGLWRHNGTG